MNGRIVSMDQFRGYTMAGMFLVNFIGGYQVVHPVFKHHTTYNSYADTIMPHFFFAVGFAFRLVLLRNLEKLGKKAAYRKAVMRCLGLILVGIIVYHLDGRYRTWQELSELGLWGFLTKSFRREPFQALVHIGVTSLYILPVVAASISARVWFMVLSGLAHLGLSMWFWYDWLNVNRVIDGGPLGFMTWSIPTLAGTIAYDVLVRDGAEKSVRTFVKWGVILSVAGYAISCLNAVFNPVRYEGIAGWLVEPPFWPPTRPVDLWTMSQKSGAISYLWFSAGFSLLVYALFVWWSDVKGRSWQLFHIFGVNPLAGYLIHSWVADAVAPFGPKDSPLWWLAVVFGIYFGLTYVFLRSLDRQKIYLRM